MERQVKAHAISLAHDTLTVKTLDNDSPFGHKKLYVESRASMAFVEALAAWLKTSMYLSVPVVSLAVAIRAIRGRFRGIPLHWQLTLFGAAWISLVLAGIYCRDVAIIIITFPLVLNSFGIYAVLWGSSAGWSMGATFFYWVGVLSVIAGSLYFGFMAATIQCVHSSCHGQYTPPQPHVARDLMLWSFPPVLVFLGLRLSGRFGNGMGGAACGLLLLINPAILWTVAWLQPSLGM